MTDQKLSSAELRWIVAVASTVMLAGEATDFASGLCVASRDVGGSGIVVELTSDRPYPATPSQQLKPLTAVAAHPALSDGAIFSLWLKDNGEPDYLDAATVGGEAWPNDSPDEFVFYGKKDQP